MCVKGLSSLYVVAWGFSTASAVKAEDYGEASVGSCGLESGTFLEIRAHQSLSTPSLSSNQER